MQGRSLLHTHTVEGCTFSEPISPWRVLLPSGLGSTEPEAWGPQELHPAGGRRPQPHLAWWRWMSEAGTTSGSGSGALVYDWGLMGV